MGNKVIYLESGSGADQSLSSEVIKEVKRSISIPLIVGGGIKTSSQIREIIHAGADIVVVGNAVEKDIQILDSLVKAIHSIR